ncbi:uncharacterized protein LOC110427329 [Herrania umbratica]|uniref:Uncharacterized protein LOC110427329 n=1 Tax=Herrania umbratica TaxID=108875 RepID=A0A6J1BG57_9ROSI|nr:uncharacterized protein LOC110427329 [Herrania umbratica]
MRKAIRGNSILALAILLLMLQYEAIHSVPVTYKVGDDYGWDLSISLQAWTRGKNFHAGDILGDDKIPLAFGGNYFICSTRPDLCAAGMKMAINATAPPPSSK